jgi:hypothetical protein
VKILYEPRLCAVVGRDLLEKGVTQTVKDASGVCLPFMGPRPNGVERRRMLIHNIASQQHELGEEAPSEPLL